MSDSRQPLAFVLMPFASAFDPTFRDLICPALYGYEVVRADTRFDERGIVEKIMTGIDDAELVVADITGTNANVMYELGVAHALGKPTIMIAQSVESLPFDIRSYPVHEYSMDPARSGFAAAQLRQLAARHREGLLLFANPVADFVARVGASMIQRVASHEMYDADNCSSDLEWASERLSSSYAIFSDISSRYTARIDEALVSSRETPQTSVTDDPGIRAMADGTRDFARELDELTLLIHAAWERFGRAMLWLLAPERRQHLGDERAATFIPSTQFMDGHLNSTLGGAAELRHILETYPDVSGNLNHALQIGKQSIARYIDEIMTAKAYLAQIARAAQPLQSG